MGNRVSEVRHSSATVRSRLAQDAADAGVEVVTELGRCGIGSWGQCPHHQHGPGRERAEPRREEVAQPTAHTVSDDGAAHGLAHHQPGARRTIVDCGAVQVDHEPGPATALPPPEHGGELVPTREPGPGRQHRADRIRRRAAGGPCHGGRR
jgi:hypothetical protein